MPSGGTLGTLTHTHAHIHPLLLHTSVCMCWVNACEGSKRQSLRWLAALWDALWQSNLLNRINVIAHEFLRIFLCCRRLPSRWQMFLVICRRCQLSVSGGHGRFPLACRRHAHSQHALAALRARSLSLSHALSLSFHLAVFLSLSLSTVCSVQLPRIKFFLFCANCCNTYWMPRGRPSRRQLKIQFAGRSLSHTPLLTLSRSWSLALAVCKVCSAFVKMAASVRASGWFVYAERCGMERVYAVIWVKRLGLVRTCWIYIYKADSKMQSDFQLIDILIVLLLIFLL